jgi:TonB family protein
MRLSHFDVFGISAVLLACSIPAVCQTGDSSKDNKFEPVIFGTYEGNLGCVVLKQQYGVRKKWLAAGTIVAVGEYEVVQTFRYDISKTKFKGQDGVNELNKIGREERVKFVVIPTRHTDLQLNVAREECQKGLPPVSIKKPSTEAPAKGAAKQPSTQPESVPPEAVVRPLAPYTAEARKAGIEGTVLMWVVVDETGNVTDARVISGLGYGLDEEALKTVKNWKFKPTTKNGKLVGATVKVEMPFKLE